MIEITEQEFFIKKKKLDLSTARISAVQVIDNTVYISYEEEDIKQETITRITVSTSLDQFAFITSEVGTRPRSSKELAAIKAKQASLEKEEKVEEKKVEKKPAPPALVQVIRDAVLEDSGPKVTVLPPVDQKPLNWKDTSIEREARKANRAITDKEVVDRVLTYIFKWHKNNDYRKSHEQKHNLGYLLKRVIPQMFNLPFENCKRYYLGYSFPEVSRKYEFQWKKLVKSLTNNGYKDKIPKYLRDHYGH